MAAQHTELAGLQAHAKQGYGDDVSQPGVVQDIQGELTFLDSGAAEIGLGRD